MSGLSPLRSAALGAVLGCTLLSGCSFWRAHTPFHRHNSAGGCTEKPFNGNTETRPPLVVPAGMSAPDTRGSVKIPELNTPERVRGKAEPCLEEPPTYGGYTVRPPTRLVPPATPPDASAVPPAPVTPAPAGTP